MPIELKVEIERHLPFRNLFHILSQPPNRSTKRGQVCGGLYQASCFEHRLLFFCVVVGPLLAASFPLSGWCLSPLTSLLGERERETAKKKVQDDPAQEETTFKTRSLIKTRSTFGTFIKGNRRLHQDGKKGSAT